MEHMLWCEIVSGTNSKYSNMALVNQTKPYRALMRSRGNRTHNRHQPLHSLLKTHQTTDTTTYGDHTIWRPHW